MSFEIISINGKKKKYLIAKLTRESENEILADNTQEICINFRPNKENFASLRKPAVSILINLNMEQE
jgi:hypothetical protein